MEKRVTISLRVPEDLLAEIRRVATEEERPLNTQVLRFIRAGLQQHQQQHGLDSRADLSRHMGGDLSARTDLT